MREEPFPSSAIRLRANAPHKSVDADKQIVPTRPLVAEPEKVKPRVHWLTSFGIGMLCVVLFLLMWNFVLVPWWQGYQDQLHYGDAHITRLDADVGHGGVSTFLAFDLHGQIIVMEMPGGHIEHARLYRVTNLIGKGFDQKIVTISVRDINGDGKPDLIIDIQGDDTPIILYNNGTSFQWATPQSH